MCKPITLFPIFNVYTENINLKLNINLEDIQNSEIDIRPYSEFIKPNINMHDYAEKIYEQNKEGRYANFYRNATDHKGNTIGIHQVKKFNFKIINDMV